MTRHCAWGSGGLRGLTMLALVLLLTLFSASMADARAQVRAAEPSIGERADGGYTLAQYAPRAQQRQPRGRPINEGRGRLRRQPDAFRGLMTPGFGASGDCRMPREIRRNLQQQGWWDFHGLRRAGDDFVVRARRPNGAVYQLRIEGCRGQVIDAEPLGGGGGDRLFAR